MIETPPAALPEGYQEIWELIRRAERRAGSRRVLARELGVATRTLQRILVTGEVPTFGPSTSGREVRAWCRTLTRLAHHFGHDPREWIERVGIHWDTTAHATVSRTLEALAADDGGTPTDPLAEIRSTRPPTVRVGLVGYHHFSEPLPSFGGSFLDALAERLFRAINPGWRLDRHWRPIPELVAGLTDDRRYHTVMGLFDTVERRSRGMDFVPIPGWRVRHSAVWIHRRDDTRPVPRWSDLMRSDEYLFHVLNQQAAHTFLQANVAEDRILLTELGRSFAEDFLESTESQAPRPVVHVNEDATVVRLMYVLRHTPEFAARYEVSEVDGAPEERPSYELGIAIAANSPAWRDLITVALAELFENSPSQMAALYSELIMAAIRAIPTEEGEPAVRPGRSAWSPEPFRMASPVFQSELCRMLLAALETYFRGGKDNFDRASALAVEQARAVLPVAWHGPLNEATRVEGGGSTVDLDDARRALSTLERALNQLQEPGAAAVCFSCGSLLGRPRPGTRLCGACATPGGDVRSRNEVEETLAAWLRSWNSGLAPRTARERARTILSTMPAWVD